MHSPDTSATSAASALPATSADKHLSSFADPAAIYRPAPLWVWNDDMESDSIRFQLRELASHGFGGAFVHPRPGLITEYLSQTWFERWGDALEEASKLGLKLYIYDENSYPSGFAGGHVPSELPDCLANSVLFNEYGPDEVARKLANASPMLNRPGHPIKAFAVREAPGRKPAWEIVRDVTLLPMTQWREHGDRFWVFELGTPMTNNWLGGFAYADLLRPEVTARFLAVTHEAYRERFGDRFGTQIPALFTDEPEISPGNLFEHGSPLPFSFWFAGEFERRNGYDLRDYLPFLFRDAAIAFETAPAVDAAKVRFDYFETIRELWVNNSVRPISQWCEANGIAYTGHYIEHQWPHPFHRTSPAVMSLYEFMQWPAIDMLETKLLRADAAKPGASSAFLPFVPPNEAQRAQGAYNDPAAMLTVREAHSAANQFGRERVLCEAYGAGGWDSSFEDYKRIGDWLYVHGINFLNQHLTYGTIVGARKRDHPQSFDWRQPWWDEYAQLNDYFGRLSYALSQGRTVNRIALFNPTTSSFVATAEAVEGDPLYQQGIVDMLALVQSLSDRQWDYDLCDEYIMEGHADVEASSLRVGQSRYEIVIVPAAMTHMKASTVALLRRFLEGGGIVIAANRAPDRVDGARSEEAAALAHLPGWHPAADAAGQLALLSTFAAPRLRLAVEGTAAPSGIAHLRRELGDGSALYFIANSRSTRFEGTATLRGRRAELWNPLDGSATALGQSPDDDGCLTLELSLNASGSLLLRVYEEAAAGAGFDVADTAPEAVPGVPQPLPRRTAASKRRPVALSAPEIVPERDNVLPILHCDLYAGTKQYVGLHTVHAARFAFEHHGFENNPWDNAVQFKRRLLDREAAFDARSGITADYHFHVDSPDDIGPVRLELERPSCYRIAVNGIPVEAVPGTSRLDRHMGAADITRTLRPGRNTIRLEGRPFSIWMELEPLYLFGQFTVAPNPDGGWRLATDRPLGLGDWRDQGYPFYSDAVRYRHSFTLPDEAERVFLSVPSWHGSVISVTVDGEQAGLLGLERGDELELTSFVRPGTVHTLDCRLSGTFRNLLGPHFDAAKPRNIAWPGAWKRSPLEGPPPAEDYDLLSYGLLAPIEIWTIPR
ncbi:glycosyl hydrolase [Cohnella hashimotonis]|uniref:Glycosyl hydrolase n=1 Tax=Cohnella hashimotonis TaxID=2826895 RepID=A0ABT6TE14_9BACL|nr:glycosyl hydrolase [Cohnella hashimotonis]MDI4645063.1 glycosyl hydrolase [Cohnella hashimotonis]